MPLDGWLGEALDGTSALVKAGKHQAAAVLACRALAVEADNAELWVNLSGALYGLRRHEQALDAALHALNLAPGHPFALGNLALAHDAMGSAVSAEFAFDAAIRADPQRPSLLWNRALSRLRRGDYERGFIDYDARIDNDPAHYPDLPRPWKGESLAGKTIYVDTEQGVGDAIMFSRFLPWLAEQAETVYFRAADPVRPLLTEMPITLVRVPVDADYSVYLGSLPRWYGLRSDDIPHDPWFIRRAVEASPEIVMPAPLAMPAIKVGLCWSGNPLGERNEERSVPLKSLLTLAMDPRVWLYSLQVGAAGYDIATLGANDLIHDQVDALTIGGFLATGRAICDLNLVVTCCTSVAHLAGALNVPCWVLLSREAYWPWFSDGRTDSPWYPSVRLFRQDKLGEWDPVIARVVEAIAELF